jgi:hypothetical protein
MGVVIGQWMDLTMHPATRFSSAGSMDGSFCPKRRSVSMSLPWVRILTVSLGLWGLAAGSFAQNQFSGPPLMPVPGRAPATGFPPYSGTRAMMGTPYGQSYGQSPYGQTTYGQVTEVAPAPIALPQAANGAVVNGNGSGWTDVLDATGTNGNGNCFADTCCPKWYVGAGWLYLKRDRGDAQALSFDGADPNNILVTSRPNDYEWEPGFEVTLGYCCCCDMAFEATYWGINEQDGSTQQIATAQASGTLNTLLDFGALTLNGVPVGDLYNTTTGSHLVVRDSRFHSVEFNLIHEICGDGVCQAGRGLWGCGHGCGHGCGTCTCWNCTWLLGLRYFQYYDNLMYATSDDNETFEFDAGEAYYGIAVDNHLIGGQIGARIDYNLGQAVSLYAMPKIGLYGNHITHDSRINTLGDEALNVHSSKNDVAFLAQLDLGVDFWLTDHWKFYGGYRAVAISGVANAEEQMSQVVSVADISNIDSSGEVIVHGAFAGLQFYW